MKIILIVFSLLLFGSGTGELPFLDDSNKNVSSETDYIDLQVNLHSTYSLYKALNAGIITQEEYDQLKKNILEI